MPLSASLKLRLPAAQKVQARYVAASQLRDAGLTYAAIGEHFGVTKQTAARLVYRGNRVRAGTWRTG